MEQIEVIPGILEQEFSRIEERVRLVAPYVNWIHIDIADHRLVPNSSFLDPSPFKKLIQETGKKFELHMMIENPLEISGSWIGVGFKRLLIHIESVLKFDGGSSKVENEMRRLKLEKIEVGLAVDKETNIEEVFPYLDDVDCVLIMTIQAGFLGRQFISEKLEKIRG